MNKDLELAESLEALLARSRKDLGERPSDSDLLAYHRRELKPPEVERIRDHLARDPAVAARYLDLTANPELGGSQRPEELSAEEMAADWQAIRAQTIDRSAAPPLSFTAASTRASRRLLTTWAVAASAGLFIASGWSWVLYQRTAELRREMASPRPHVAAYVLQPDAPRLGPGDLPAARIHPDVNGMHLTLTFFGIELRDLRRLEIRDIARPGEPLLWSRDLADVDRDGITLNLPPSFLPPGEYELRLSGSAGEVRATYHVIVQE